MPPAAPSESSEPQVALVPDISAESAESQPTPLDQAEDQVEHAIEAPDAPATLTEEPQEEITNEAGGEAQPSSAEYWAEFNRLQQKLSETDSRTPEFTELLVQTNEAFIRSNVAKIREAYTTPDQTPTPAPESTPSNVISIVKRGETAPVPTAPTAPIEVPEGLRPQATPDLRAVPDMITTEGIPQPAQPIVESGPTQAELDELRLPVTPPPVE